MHTINGDNRDKLQRHRGTEWRKKSASWPIWKFFKDEPVCVWLCALRHTWPRPSTPYDDKCAHSLKCCDSGNWAFEFAAVETTTLERVRENIIEYLHNSYIWSVCFIFFHYIHFLVIWPVLYNALYAPFK